MGILEQFSLEGRTALVTGSSKGIGRAAAVALASAGADVALLNRGDASGTAAEIRALGRRAVEITRDLAEATPGELASDVDRAISELGRLDILVNNAGTIHRAPAVDYPADAWDTVLRVNLDALFHLSQAAGRHMVERGSGRIISIASMLSFQGGILVPAYTASKHAVAGVTRALANEWAASGVTVNAIAPGYIDTDNTEALRADPEREASIRGRIPAGRWGRPDDLTGALVFLASPAAAYVTGAILPVDGGWLVR